MPVRLAPFPGLQRCRCLGWMVCGGWRGAPRSGQPPRPLHRSNRNIHIGPLAFFLSTSSLAPFIHIRACTRADTGGEYCLPPPLLRSWTPSPPSEHPWGRQIFFIRYLYMTSLPNTLILEKKLNLSKPLVLDFLIFLCASRLDLSWNPESACTCIHTACSSGMLY